MHDADIGHHGLGQDAGYFTVSEGVFERWQIVEFDHLGCDRWIDGRADVAAPRAGGAIRMKSDEGFIDRAVVAPVEHQDFGTAGDLPRQADGEAVGIGRSQGKLPVGQAESLLQFLCNKNRILRRQHQRDAAAHLFFHGLHGGERRMAGHGAGVSQA